MRSMWARTPSAVRLAIGLVLYFVYSYRNSTLRRGLPPRTFED